MHRIQIKVAMKQGNRNRSSVMLATLFLGFIALGILAGKLPPLVFVPYIASSVLAFAAYALDKSAARSNQWRIRESTLHLFSLVGGWPGALLAQAVLRHKTRKASFQVTFWATVFIHCGALAWLLSPYGANTMRAIM